jgi:copper chaperone NosL
VPISEGSVAEGGRFRRIVLVSLLAALVGCGGKPLEPEPVPLNQVTCARCGMVVSREADSAEWVARGEDPRFYDDIGCLATDDLPSRDRSARFVHVGSRWEEAETVFFARPAGASTPMGYGVIAFASRQEAAARDRANRARTWAELVRELRAEAPGRRNSDNPA